MKKVLLVLVIIILVVFNFIFGWSLCSKKTTDEMRLGPVYGINENTRYLQNLYESAYELGVIKGIISVYGDDSKPMYKTYYEWMQEWSKDPDNAIYNEYDKYLEYLKDHGLEYYAEILDGYLS